jgi:hypothetical protein
MCRQRLTNVLARCCAEGYSASTGVHWQSKVALKRVCHVCITRHIEHTAFSRTLRRPLALGSYAQLRFGAKNADVP